MLTSRLAFHSSMLRSLRCSNVQRQLEYLPRRPMHASSPALLRVSSLTLEKKQSTTSEHSTGEPLPASTSGDVQSRSTGDRDGAGGVKPRFSPKITRWNKWALVYTKAYPDEASIPDSVPISKITTSHDKLRVRAAIYLSIFCLFCCLVVSVNGSRARKAGTGTKIGDYARDNAGLAAEQPISKNE